MGSSSYPPEFLYTVSTALQCIIFLAGFVVGILLLTRKRTLPGILALAAFALLGLGALTDLVIFDIIAPSSGYNETIAWASLCLWNTLSLLGMIGLVVFAFLSLGKKEVPPPPPPLPPLE